MSAILSNSTQTKFVAWNVAKESTGSLSSDGGIRQVNVESSKKKKRANVGKKGKLNIKPKVSQVEPVEGAKKAGNKTKKGKEKHQKAKRRCEVGKGKGKTENTVG